MVGSMYDKIMRGIWRLAEARRSNDTQHTAIGQRGLIIDEDLGHRFWRG
jgi:hypothetical protein